MSEQGFFRIDNQPHRLTLSGDYADAVVVNDACDVVDAKPQTEQLEQPDAGAAVDGELRLHVRAR